MPTKRATSPPKPAVETALAARFAESRHRLSERRRRLVQSLLDSPDETYYLSSRDLAKRYDVDAATIVRTVQALGYERFADFAADLRHHFVSRITPYTRMREATRSRESVADFVQHSLDRDAENLDRFRSSGSSDRLIEFARRVHRSRRILVVGVDYAATLAWAIAYGLVRLGFDAEAPAGSSGNVQHKVRILTPADLLVAISFGQGLRDTVEAVEHARAEGVPTFGLTDGDATPIARLCDVSVGAPTTGTSFLASYAAPMAAVDAMLIACAHVDPKRSLELLRRADETLGPGSRWYQQSPSRRTRIRRGEEGG